MCIRKLSSVSVCIYIKVESVYLITMGPISHKDMWLSPIHIYLTKVLLCCFLSMVIIIGLSAYSSF